MGWRVIVLVSAILKQQVAQLAVLDVCQVSEVVAVVVLHGQSADDVPAVVLVVGVPYQTIGVLFQSFFADEVHLLMLLAVAVDEVLQSVFRQLVLVAELLVVAIAVGVVQRGCCGPVLVDVPSHRQNVVVLPEVVGSLVPQRTISHFITLHLVAAVRILDEETVLVSNQSLVE